ncbi:hypothetical protein AB0N05_05890 [Nocardia sp. NPDC051030]|uniref:hypothetical protein n=1 Tax=Nocardia sp. NPDC051030 TaxID=3155162 RepID=UPI003440A158
MTYPPPQPNEDPAQRPYSDPAAQQSYPHPYPPAQQPYPAASGPQPYQDPAAYQPYPGMAQYPGGPAAGERKPPQSVMNAFYLMLAGAVLTLLSTLYGFTQLSTVRDKASESSDGTLTQSNVDTIVKVSFGFGIVIALISIGLWIWMAFANRAGKNWARITSTVFFGLYSLSMLLTVVSFFLPTSDTPVISTIFGFVTWFVGLAALILLWTKQSSTYFRPAPTYAPYPGPYPGPPR